MISKKVLVIEDEAAIANVIKAIFRINAIDVVFAHNGYTGLQMLEEKNISLILCDIMLPDINGYQILEWVKRNSYTSNIPFIFLTAFADQADVKKGMDNGADDYITKPFLAKNLVDTVRSKLLL